LKDVLNNEEVREASRLQVPLSPARRAAMQAIAVVKTGMTKCALCRLSVCTSFIRILRGQQVGRQKEIRFLRPSMTDAEFRGNRQAWLAALTG